jgi:NTP pyrophosphatase (non-canonical NTP hydrolase)
LTLLHHETNALHDIQRLIGNANANKGFHEEGDAIRHAVAIGDAAEYVLTNYYANKLLLIVSEIVEAHDELRAGRSMTETWYVENFGHEDQPAKPEGVPSELADAVIRCFDLADEAGIDLAAIIDEKLAYNATRPFKHGKKF